MYAQARNRLADLLRIAAELGIELTPRMRRDWTGLGFLAPATPEGKPGESGGGVLRYWTPEQTDVFRAVLDRYAERVRRYELANVPVAFWLLPFDGENCVPLVQVRRALATFTAAAWTKERITAMVKRGVLAAPKVEAAEPELRERVEGLVKNDLATRPQGADSAWLARLLATRGGLPPVPAGSSIADESIREAIELRIREDSEAALRGLATFRALDDDAYRGARKRYRGEYELPPPDKDDEYLRALPPDELDAIRRDVHGRYPGDYLHAQPPDVLAKNACADLLTVLGRIASERGLA